VDLTALESKQNQNAFPSQFSLVLELILHDILGYFEYYVCLLRKLLRAICMTACDLSACTKPWEIQLEIVKVIYQEFYAEVSDSDTQ